MGGDVDGLHDNSVENYRLYHPDAMRFASAGDIDLNRLPDYKWLWVGSRLE